MQNPRFVLTFFCSDDKDQEGCRLVCPYLKVGRWMVRHHPIRIAQIRYWFGFQEKRGTVSSHSR